MCDQWQAREKISTLESARNTKLVHAKRKAPDNQSPGKARENTLTAHAGGAERSFAHSVAEFGSQLAKKR